MLSLQGFKGFKGFKGHKVHHNKKKYAQTANIRLSTGGVLFCSQYQDQARHERGIHRR